MRLGIAVFPRPGNLLAAGDADGHVCPAAHTLVGAFAELEVGEIRTLACTSEGKLLAADALRRIDLRRLTGRHHQELIGPVSRARTPRPTVHIASGRVPCHTKQWS